MVVGVGVDKLGFGPGAYRAGFGSVVGNPKQFEAGLRMG